jgi:hypothetical protein
MVNYYFIVNGWRDDLSGVKLLSSAVGPFSGRRAMIVFIFSVCPSTFTLNQRRLRECTAQKRFR